MQNRITLEFLQDCTAILARHVKIQQYEARIGLPSEFRIGTLATQIFQKLNTILDEINWVPQF